MPGMGRSKYWWRKYHAGRRRGRTKKQAAISASYAQRGHRLKIRRRH